MIDDFAKAGGWFTATLAWACGFFAPVGAFAPAEAEALVRIIIAIIGGLFGLVGTALAVLLRFYLQNRKKE